MKDRIRQIREESGLSQSEFAEKIEMSKTGLQNIEYGKNRPAPNTRRTICDVFNIRREWLETGEGPMHKPQIQNDIEMITRAMEGQNENKKRLIRILADMPDELLDQMMDYFDSKRS